jgi:hypothetical protein
MNDMIQSLQLIHERLLQLELQHEMGNKSSYNGDVRPIEREIDNYWLYLTGWKNNGFEFTFDGDDLHSICDPDPSMFLLDKIKPYVTNKNGILLDGFGCVGGSTIPFMYEFNNAQVVTVQRVRDNDPIEQKRFQNLKKNVEGFLSLMASNGCKYRTKPQLIASPIKEYLELKAPLDIEIAMFDPPWKLSYDAPEADINQLIEYLDENCFQPMVKKQISIELILLMVRQPWQDFKQVLKKLDGYELLLSVYACPRKGKYYYHVLRKGKSGIKPELFTWTPSEACVEAYHL